METNTKLQSVWGVFGYDTKQQRYDLLNYIADTAEEAANKATTNYPTFEVDRVDFVAHF
jgi:hypothetical protein